MRLWTIQPKSWYESLCADGIIHCDPAKAEMIAEGWFKKPYAWMAGQMRERIGPPPEGVIYPIWAWHTYQWEHRRPHSEEGYAEGYGEEPVCIEIEIPDGQVLLSDEENWCFVLNDSYYPDATCDEEYDREMAAYDALAPEEALRVKLASWQKVFNVDRLDSKWERRGCYIQGCFWELRLEQVIGVYPVS